MNRLTSRRGFSLLNGAGTSPCRSVSSVSNIKLIESATSSTDRANQSSKYFRLQYKGIRFRVLPDEGLRLGSASHGHSKASFSWRLSGCIHRSMNSSVHSTPRVQPDDGQPPALSAPSGEASSQDPSAYS
jgi:hypothetical protein